MIVTTIGHIQFERGGSPVVAVLRGDGHWECEAAPAVADALNRDYSPIGKRSASGNWGEWELIAAACYLKGVAHPGPPTA